MGRSWHGTAIPSCWRRLVWITEQPGKRIKKAVLSHVGKVSPLRLRRKVVLVTGGLVVVAIGAAAAVIGPSNVVGMLRYDIRDEGKLTAGDRAPDVELVTPEGARVRFAERLAGAKPVVVIFGSFT